MKVCEGKSVTLRTWKRVARKSQKSNVDKQPSSMDRRPEMDCIEVESNKKKCMVLSNSHDEENLEMVAGSQQHRMQ